MLEADPTALFFVSLSSAVGVDTVFGEPIAADGRMVIPVAETSIGGGVGVTHMDGKRRELALPRMASGGGGGAITARSQPSSSPPKGSPSSRSST